MVWRSAAIKGYVDGWAWPEAGGVLENGSPRALDRGTFCNFVGPLVDLSLTTSGSGASSLRGWKANWLKAEGSGARHSVGGGSGVDRPAQRSTASLAD